jgi:hypothetical protein
MVTPTMFPVDKNNGGAHKMVEHTNVLIPWYPISYLTIATVGFTKKKHIIQISIPT